MPRGLKETSSTISIGFTAVEAVAGTNAQATIDLNLDPLNQEVFVVQSINLDPEAPDVVSGTNTSTASSLTSTSQTTVTDLSNANCLATSRLDIRSEAALVGLSAGVPFARASTEAPSTGLEYIGIIATNNFFVQVKGTSNLGVKSCTGKVYGYRARADASIYSALVSSEVLSA